MSDPLPEDGMPLIPSWPGPGSGPFVYTAGQDQGASLEYTAGQDQDLLVQNTQLAREPGPGSGLGPTFSEGIIPCGQTRNQSR